MNTTHTPSPWIVSHDPDGTSDDYCIGVPDGKVDQIAVCSKRDAPIISAAPDMYAALCDAMEFFEISGAEQYPVADKARAALAKARGQ